LDGISIKKEDSLTKSRCRIVGIKNNQIGTEGKRRKQSKSFLINEGSPNATDRGSKKGTGNGKVWVGFCPKKINVFRGREGEWVADLAR